MNADDPRWDYSYDPTSVIECSYCATENRLGNAKCSLCGVSLPAQNAKIKRQQSSKKGIINGEVAETVGGCLMMLLYVFGALTLVGWLWKGVPWLSEHVLPWAFLASGIAIFIFVPIGLALCIFRRSRSVGAAGLFVSSYIAGFTLWLWAFITARTLAGMIWLIIGLGFAGLGVVPIAIIAALIHGEISISVQLIILAVIVYGTRVLSIWLAAKAEDSRPLTSPDESIGEFETASEYFDRQISRE
jgi:hypothetical protein